MQRYFLQEPYEAKAVFAVSGEPFHHMIRVMRMTPGAKVGLVFEDHLAIIAKIKEAGEETVYLEEVEKEQQDKELPLQVTIASGYPKGDKLELIVQKGTELGAAAFIGFPAQTSVVKWDQKKLQKKQQRLQKIAQEAAEQSQRQIAPAITLLDNAKAFWQSLSQYDAVLVAYEESAKQGEAAMLLQVITALPVGSKVLAIFGPEGGLTPSEIEEAQQNNAKLCGLGPRILRTETAPFYFLSAVSVLTELKRM
ncbi:16S rRNA (uracil(1498)-N(3))-methyltransferase [Enterococcus casseliflavus]|uniref:16S rRNA (uracil(1498)-N(3))-methyltransferase n=1 Tax=Enterococcus casseliflavus TaxID=37734 RepID=UPI003D6C007C